MDMKAFEIREFGIDKLALVDHETPTVRPDEVLVRIRAASLNYRDVMVADGAYNPRMKLPAIPLSDAAGEIVETGSEVSGWKAGDRVMPLMVQRWFDGESSEDKRRTATGAGSFWNGVARECAAFRQDAVVRIPEHLSFEEASTLPCAGLTAWHALAVSGDLKPGETVLTLGTGGVSTFAVQFAKLFGARVIATTSSNEKIAKLRELGSDETINYRETEAWDNAVIEMTGGRGVDHVVEVGGAGTLQRSINAARVNGHIAMVGALDTSGSFNHVPIFMKALRLQGIFVGSKTMFEGMNRAIELSKLRPVIDRTFKFEELPDALNYMQTGSHFGKIVITY
jgi:NADPH:quinone reductase-like Zn-dependent oxidoreductase